MRFVIVLAWMALALVWSGARADDRKGEKADAAGLVGTYRITGGEEGGKELPADRLKDVTVQIGENAITTFDKNKKEVYAATYTIDTARKPWRISMTATVAGGGEKGEKAQGLIEADGDTVKLIYTLPGGKVPTEFKTGAKQLMFVMKKAGK